MRQRRGFTLVELLVVVGIIAILVGILIPTLMKARESADQVVCQSNLKQLANGFMGYRTEFKNFMPTAMGDPAMASTWPSAFDFYPYASGLAPYCWADVLIRYKYATRDLIACPSMEKSGLVGPSGTILSDRVLAYGINAFLDQTPGRLPRDSVYPASTAFYQPWAFKMIKRPSEGVLLADSNAPGITAHYAHPAQGNARGILRHRKKQINVLFFDLHVEPFEPSKKKIFYDSPPYGTFNVYSVLVTPQASNLWRPWSPHAP